MELRQLFILQHFKLVHVLYNRQMFHYISVVVHTIIRFIFVVKIFSYTENV